MQLRMARLCLDCEEIHAAQRCPVCASESFAFLSRWIPAPERRTQPRPSTSDPNVDQERLEAVRGLTTGRMLTGGVVGLTALSLIGWLWQRSGPPESAANAPEKEGPSPHAGKADSADSTPGAR